MIVDLQGLEVGTYLFTISVECFVFGFYPEEASDSVILTVTPKPFLVYILSNPALAFVVGAGGSVCIVLVAALVVRRQLRRRYELILVSDKEYSEIHCDESD